MVPTQPVQVILSQSRGVLCPGSSRMLLDSTTLGHTAPCEVTTPFSFTLHPFSTPSDPHHGWCSMRVVFNEVIQTSKQYMRDVTVIKPGWLYELAPHFYEYGTERELAEAKRRRTDAS
ncbi:Probable ATP-dependent RNA helicase DHX35 homolog [Geodia barretti]|uniref:Probable ATP-dependent RNA helicase DHX35 homolog n=1 Tax=Geodia barretti TaxID=519541 RepID=A0AA35RR00_GEOBA|nr:Probable ATP-dependent RNA helicase DHX35 homolog [Geodia barretti]